MAHAKQREMDLVTGEPIEESLTVAGSMTVTFYDAGGHMIPKVSFAPLGRINPNTIDRYLPFIYQEIQKQQVLEKKR